MSHGGEAADMLVRDGIEVTEAAVKLAALGAKNLAAILIALAQDEHKKGGLTNITRMLKEGQPLKVLPIKAEDVKRFGQEAKQYGILCTSIADRADPEGDADIIVREGDVGLVCRILERMGYALPEEEKNGPSRAQQENRSAGRGTTSKASAPGMTIEGMAQDAPAGKATAPSIAIDGIRPDAPAEKTSVVKRIEAIKKAAGKLPQKPSPEITR